jgi:hypothetical protein
MDIGRAYATYVEVLFDNLQLCWFMLKHRLAINKAYPIAPGC